MFRKLSETGTSEACHDPIVAAHFRLSAQMISVNTATPRMNHPIAFSFECAGSKERAQPETRKRLRAGGREDVVAAPLSQRARRGKRLQIGRASCRARVCQDV